MSLLEVENLNISFERRGRLFPAVQDVSFSIGEGETLGLVGESGSGKSVTAMALMDLLPRQSCRVEADRMVFDGQNLLTEAKALRGRAITMVFQDPMTSLNPNMRLDRQLLEPLLTHGILGKTEALARVLEVMEEVGIPNPADRVRSFPHQFSGGMRQRVMIAMAMLTRPKLLIADEPTTALDVTIQKQILELMQRLQREHGTSILFISHDLAVVREVSRRIAVMWDSHLVEEVQAEQLFQRAKHPYTKALLRCHPGFHPPGTRLKTLKELMEAEV